VEAEGYRPGAYRIDPVSTVAARRHGARSAAALLRLRLPAKKALGALRSALASKFADGKLIVVNSFEVKEPKTKLFRESLDKLKVDSTVAGR
jgi:ribosomal protein L4